MPVNTQSSGKYERGFGELDGLGGDFFCGVDGVGVFDGVCVAVGVGVADEVGVGVSDGVDVGVMVGDGVDVPVGVGDGVDVLVGVGDGVEVGVAVGEGVTVALDVGVGDGDISADLVLNLHNPLNMVGSQNCGISVSLTEQ